MAAAEIQDLAKRVQDDDELKQALKTDPEAALKKEAKAAAVYRSDAKFYRIAVIGLIAIILLVVVTAITVQIWKEEQVSDWIAALGTTALGGLVGLFATPSGN